MKKEILFIDFQNLVDSIIKDDKNKPLERVALKDGHVLIYLGAENVEQYERSFAIFNRKSWFLVRTDAENIIDSIEIDSNATRFAIDMVLNDNHPANLITLASGLIDSEKQILISDGSKIIVAKTDLGRLFYFIDAQGKEGFKALEIKKGSLYFDGSMIGRTEIERYFNYICGKPFAMIEAIDNNGNKISF